MLRPSPESVPFVVLTDANDDSPCAVNALHVESVAPRGRTAEITFASGTALWVSESFDDVVAIFLRAHSSYRQRK